MARALTSPELTLLRADGQWTKLYLATPQYNTIYTARLDVVPTSTDLVSQIAFDTGSGTLSNVKPGMTLYVGTSAGAYDLGMCWIRKDPVAGTFYIGLTSEIDWQADCYLTVVDDFDLQPKHAVIDAGALKMNVDVAYSDQHTNFHPVPVLGPHAVAWLDGATVDVGFTASSSWVHGSTISGYSWSAPGASATSGLTTATPTITYNAPGFYRVFCTVTAANGKTTTGVRHVFVYDRGDNQPATVFQLAQCVGDYDTGGWMFDLTMEAEASLSEIRDRSLVVLFAEDWYGFPPNQTQQSIGPIAGRENIVCVGRIVGESIRWDRETGLVHFTVQGAHHWLNKIKAFPIELLFATNTPDSWSVIPSMTVDRILWHILYWHSTVIETMDFYRTGDTRLAPDGRTLASMIWSQLIDIAQSRMLAAPGVDRFGRLIVQIDPQMIPEADRSSIPTVMTLTDDDWQEGIDLQRVTVEDVSMITLSSQLTNDSGATSTLYSLSPGHVPRRYGEPFPLDRLLAASQSQSNSLAGLALGWHANPFPDVPVVLLQNNRMFDMWPHEFAALTVTDTDTPRGIAYDGNLIPRRITLLFDGESSYMHPELNFEGETFEQVNTDGDIPDVEDTSIPPFPPIDLDLPDLSITFPGDPSASPSGPSFVVIVDANKGILYTKNFNTATSSEIAWQFANAGIPTLEIPRMAEGSFRHFTSVFMTPNGAVYVATWRVGGNWMENVYRAPAIGGMFVKVIDQDWIDANEGNDSRIAAIGFNPTQAEEVGIVFRNTSTYAGHMWIGNGSTGFVQKGLITVDNDIAGKLTYGGGKWIFDGKRGAAYYWVRVSGDGMTLEHQTATFGQGGGFHTRAGSGSKIFTTVNLSHDFLYSLDNAANTTQVEVPEGLGGVDRLAVTPDGTYLLGNWDTGNRGKSSDGGNTWSGLPNLPFGSTYAFAYAGGTGTASRWIAARGIIRYSDNVFGAESWVNKEGNINFLIPVSLTITKVIVPGL
jgi:hypothetical protein